MFSCANESDEVNPAARIIASEILEVFMLLILLTTSRGVKPFEKYQGRGKKDGKSSDYQPRTFAKISGATIVASDSIIYFGVSVFSFPQVIFSLGTAPEYDPKLVVESLIWQK